MKRGEPRERERERERERKRERERLELISPTQQLPPLQPPDHVAFPFRGQFPRNKTAKEKKTPGRKMWK
jgi:hypothetical protein